MGNTIDGIIEIKSQGFGFVLVDGGDDVFVHADELNGALHGDLVRVTMNRRRGRTEGEVVKILERGVQNIVGTLLKSKNGTFVIPDDSRLGDGFDVLGDVPSDAVGKKVVVRLKDKDGLANFVELVEVLGDEYDVGVDILAIIRAHNLYQEFPKEVEAEAAAVCKSKISDEAPRRLDLRKKNIITIDPADAKDLDDALYLEMRDDGLWELGVHIADVAHYVRENSLLDEEAFKRGTSVYFPDRVLPMLPKALSNDVCSLNPNVDRLALSVIMTIDPNGEVVSHRIHESIINVQTRFSYEEVQDILDNGCAANDKVCKRAFPMISDMAVLCQKIEKRRRARGEVVFDVPEPKIVLDPETGKIRDVVAYPHLLSHRIVETFMILCNEVVAKHMSDLDRPAIYRIHERPDPRKVDIFIETLKPFAVQHQLTPENPSGQAYQAMLDKLSPEVKPIVSALALRSMQKAKYSPKNVGHFGLGATHYLHFTSPIRRYPDLIVHRIIKMMLNRKLSTHKEEELRTFVTEASIQASKCEVAATLAEREVDDLKRAEYMQDKIGEQFTGTISGIRDFGVFVYFPNTVEGLVRIENMPKDAYAFNERQMTLVGRKRTYKMGDKLDVIVAGVNMPRRQVEFSAQV